MYLSQLQNVFVSIAKCICLNGKMYLSQLQNIFVSMAKSICLNRKIYLYQWQNVFVLMAKCICLNGKIYLSQMQYVFVRLLIMMLMLGLSGSYQVSGWTVNGRELAAGDNPFISASS